MAIIPVWRPKRSIVFFVVFLVVPLCFSTALFGQSPPPQEAPAIRTTTRLVVLNVVVTDKSGRPVSGLNKEDFAVLENGQNQAINSFEPPSILAPSPEAASTSSTNFVAANISQPRTILVLDELNTISEDTMFGAQELRKFLKAQPPVLRQPTSIYVLTKRKLDLLASSTTDRDALLAKLKTDFIELPPHDLVSGGIQGAANRLITSLMALDEIALANANQKGRKNILWIGNAMTILSDTHVGHDDSVNFKNWVHYTANWLQESQTTVYTIDPRGVEVSPAAVSTGGLLLSGGIPAGGIVGPDFTSSELVFESVAPESGGAIFRTRNDIDVAIADAVSDGSTYYTLSYYPTNTNWDGNFRQIKIQVNPSKLVARTQRGYYAYPDGFAEQQDQIEFGLSRAIMTPVAFESISFSAKGRIVPASRKPPQQKGTSFLRSGRKSTVAAGLPAARIEVTIERDALSWTPQTDPQTNKEQHTEFVLVTSSVGTAGQVLDNEIHRLEFTQKQELFDRVPPEPVKLFVFADLPPKANHLRLVVRDASTGRLGTFDLPVSALSH